MIYVGIDNIGGNSGRVYDLTPPGLSVSGSDLNQGGDRFLDFIEKELLPAVDRQLRGGAPRLMIGHSSGAILATYAAATRPAFLGVVAIDGPLQFQDWWLVKRLASRSSTPDASPLRYVFLESTAGLRNFGWPDKVWNDLVAATPKNWMLYREKLRHEGHESMVFPAAYAGLKEIFSDYSRMTASTRTAAEMLAHYRSVSESFGATLTPPSRVLRETITDLLSESQGGAAREAFELLVAGYGAPEDSAGLAADIAEVESAPRPTETVADLLATPFPTPTQVERYAGEWVGDVWMESGQPRTGDFRLRVRVDEGKVIAETRNANAPPELAGWIPVQYLKVTPQGLTWGRMNGMRPRGVALWEGRLSGDTLSGTMRFGGIVFEYPESMSPGFLLVRVRR
jgi:hypothetical protein